mgnify:CR=1 FL=1
MFEKLFTPIKIRGMELKHRIVMPAMGTKFSGQASYVTPTHNQLPCGESQGRKCAEYCRSLQCTYAKCSERVSVNQ